ncbi:hypothetical protein T01_8773 [Trichinella spiralis]|uniref:Uncharacterized protein n=1 Tax=Trichinella spiralis TaxID=6334 RepID=A0A0V1BAN2_TRISP|nr:hypothetical protein T01_8773 [Trichinella spiralis]
MIKLKIHLYDSTFDVQCHLMLIIVTTDSDSDNSVVKGNSLREFLEKTKILGIMGFVQMLKLKLNTFLIQKLV